MVDRKGRVIPWAPVIKFHWEIAKRAERGFFSLTAKDPQAERWTSLDAFEPETLQGPWKVGAEQLISKSFRQAVEQGQHEALFLGGPGHASWERNFGSQPVLSWRPLLYREVELKPGKNDFAVVPMQGKWGINPLVYHFLDRLSITVSDDIDDFVGQLIEASTRRIKASASSMTEAIMESLYGFAPELESELNSTNHTKELASPPSSWVLFAPATRFGPLTRNLINDYERLDKLFGRKKHNVGGFKVFEDRQQPKKHARIDLLPLLPLNKSQRPAAEEILAHKTLSVISGPPGCGKSQVVVATLLNAWAMGRTVLFASNNNKAVDVVRERLEHFESEFPIAVRAGNRERNNIAEVLRRSLNMISGAKESKNSKDEKRLKKYEELSEKIVALKENLASQLPQRIDQARKSALQAYAEYRKRLAEINERENQLDTLRNEIGFSTKSASQVLEIFNETKHWIGRIQHFRDLVRDDNRTRSELSTQKLEFENRCARAAGEVGLSTEDAGDWNWLVSGPNPEQILDWEQRFRSIVETPIEQSLVEIDWKTEYEVWPDADVAQDWSDRSKAFVEIVRKTTAELNPVIAEVELARKRLVDEKERTVSCGLPETIDAPTAALRNWVSTYAELTTRETAILDFLPWSTKRRLQRTLTSIEREVRPFFPLKLWTDIGVLSEEGRKNLAPILEQAGRWIEERERWSAAEKKFTEIENRFESLRSQAAVLKVPNIPTSHQQESWVPVIEYCDKQSDRALEASAAWRKRAEKDDAVKKLRDIVAEWDVVASGVPIREAWVSGQGNAFVSSIHSLRDTPSRETVVGIRSALYSGVLNKLITAWKSSIEWHQKLLTIQSQILNTPEPSERMDLWWRERPESAFLLNEKTETWPETDDYQASLVSVDNWLEDHQQFIDEGKPALQSKAQEEQIWANEQLMQAIDMLPVEEEKKEANKIFKHLSTDGKLEWPIDQLNDLFAAFRIDRIEARIRRLESDLERRSFDEAKSRWLERMKADDEAVNAVDQLETIIKKNRGAVPEHEYETFRKALRAVPIWITTAQAPQAIPLEPNLFDIVVIDEASQCTLTNILPLIYRGQSLAVIGDDQQLPAIPTVGEAEESAVANKYGVEEFLSVIGHASNNVYGAATSSLPRRRADVVYLNEHFRSHPQIIGFSNRHIYQQRLELKKKPDWGKRLPIANGVHGTAVTGTAHKGDGGGSWLNQKEADTVINLVKQLREGDSRSLSLGVVTPFSAQKEYMRNRLSEMQLTSEVLVDSAHGFQGDERDVMIFSPVVARGITTSACRWVESPPNLINVALTRAREALFVVADFDFCKQQQGILRQLALYVEEIQLLRDTSEAELELFSWMVVEGFTPKVHQKIGDIEVDFVLNGENGEKVAIEVDGREYHENRTEQDKARDAFLRGQGFNVIRVSARAVSETPFEVLHKIREELKI